MNLVDEKWGSPSEKLLVSIFCDIKDAISDFVPAFAVYDAASDLIHEAIEDLVSYGSIAEIPSPEDSVDVHEKWCKESEEKITLKIRELMGESDGHSNMEPENRSC